MLNVAEKPGKLSLVASKTVRAPNSVKIRHGVVVTPELATKWLIKNTDNRRIVKSVVRCYAEDLKLGRWQFAGDPIRFDKSGRLIDGQHRLMAIIAAGVAVECIVIEGMPVESQNIFDLTHKRRASDVLSLSGVSCAVAVAAAARWLVDFKAGKRVKGRLSNPHILQIVETHPKLESSATRVYQADVKRKFVLGPRPTLAIAMHYVGAYLLKEADRAEAFLSVFETGKPNYKGDPAQMWRERLIRLRASDTPVTRELHMRGIIHAWNLFVERKTEDKFLPPPEVSIAGLDPRKI